MRKRLVLFKNKNAVVSDIFLSECVYFPSVFYFLDLTCNQARKALVNIVGRIADEKKQESITVPVRRKILSYTESGEHMPDLGPMPQLREGTRTAICDSVFASPEGNRGFFSKDF